MSDYKMVMRLWKGRIGHMAVELHGPDGERRVVGFGPANGGVKAAYGPGDANREKDREEIDGDRTNASAPIDLTKDQFERFTRYADRAREAPPDYFALGQNCVQFALDGLKEAGVEEPDLAMRFPPEALRDGGAAAEMLIRRSAGLTPDERPDTGVNQDTYDDDRVRRHYVDPEARKEWLRQNGREDPVGSVASPPKPADSGPQDAKDGTGFPVALPPSPVPLVETRPFPVGIPRASDAPPDAPEDPTPSAPAQAPARKQPDAGDADPGLAAFRARVAAPVADRGLAALLKPDGQVTEGEYRALIDAAATRKPGDPLRYALYDKSWAVAGHVYGNGPQTFDGGKPVEPRPVNPFPEAETPVDLSGMARVARAVEGAAATDGLPEAVRHLQRGVNLGNPKEPLKEDGVYGPVTDFAAKRLVAAKGPEAAENAVALGRFNTFARAARRDGRPDGLDRATQAAFGPLLPQGATAHAEVLQETLNRRGGARLDDWTDLRVDGRVGQKTTAAFGRLLAEDDPDELTRDLGRGLGIA